MPIRHSNHVFFDTGATLESESETRPVNKFETSESPESFSAECWYRTALLRLLVEDLEAALSNDPKASLTTKLAHLIRTCESPLRELLGKHWQGQVEELAKKNRSRLRVFDQRVGEGIENPYWLDFTLLKYTLEVWQHRLVEDHPTLGRKLHAEMPFGSRTCVEQDSNIDASSCRSVSLSDVFQRWTDFLERSSEDLTLSNMAKCDGVPLHRLSSMVPPSR